MLASYASFPDNSKGRLFIKTEDPSRDCYQRDRDRIIHSSAFRRLMYKTQVFTNSFDSCRTRLTHTLEVAQIARSIARMVSINEDLTESIALAHDIGHPPFGHEGEEALLEAAGGHYIFNHNAQAIRILTELEQKYIDFNGLNLTWETIEGLAKHNGPIIKTHQVLEEYSNKFDLCFDKQTSLEGQIAALSDDIAYSLHDIDDGLSLKIISYNDLKNIPIMCDYVAQFEKKHPGVEHFRIVHKSIRKIIGFLIKDVVSSINDNIRKYSIEKSSDIRDLNVPIATFSDEVSNKVSKLKKFLSENIYQNYRIKRNRNGLKRVIKELFNVLYEDPYCLPEDWYRKFINSDSLNKKVQTICDYIGCLTDRSAIIEHRRYFGNYCQEGFIDSI